MAGHMHAELQHQQPYTAQGNRTVQSRVVSTEPNARGSSSSSATQTNTIKHSPQRSKKLT
jgi:hypothetical protein